MYNENIFACIFNYGVYRHIDFYQCYAKTWQFTDLINDLNYAWILSRKNWNQFILRECWIDANCHEEKTKDGTDILTMSQFYIDKYKH